MKVLCSFLIFLPTHWLALSHIRPVGFSSEKRRVSFRTLQQLVFKIDALTGAVKVPGKDQVLAKW